MILSVDETVKNPQADHKIPEAEMAMASRGY